MVLGNGLLKLPLNIVRVGLDLPLEPFLGRIFGDILEVAHSDICCSACLEAALVLRL